ncbi:MAG: family 78 glycoside hydrolase catalytic domain, partial [Gemmiger sp.]|nr:family 78 glycoside hydrolase catalytic domain [Gemmiger sp.]
YWEASRGSYLRGTFAVKPGLKAAYACTTALGLYNFYLNGQKVGRDEMTPGWTSYHKHLTYQTYEVTALLKAGPNAAGAMLGAGWFKGVMGLTRARNNYGDRTAFAMQLRLCYEDGTTQTVCTGPSWQGADSPVVFSEIYHGETYDAALEIAGWAEAAPPAGNWRATALVPWDTATLRAQASAKVQVVDRLPARRVFTTPGGDTVVDFGQNMAGRIAVCASGNPGDVIELRCFETLDAAGNVYLENLRHAKTTETYIFARPGQISWHPRFTYMGFRYALVVAFPGEPRAENFTACSLHSAMEPTGGITCDNELLNGLCHNYLWGLKSNFLDVPTDCPQRDERLGWTGDAQIFCRTACYLMDTQTFYKKWLVDVAADQMPDGGVPHVVPNIEAGHTQDNWLLSNSPYGASAWGDVAVILPWTLYQMYGDKRVLETQYASMKRWIEFMRANTGADGIWNFKMQLGDWVALDAEPGSYFGATPTALTCQAYYAYSTALFAKAAAVLGRAADAAAYQKLYEKIVETYQKTFFTPDGDLTAQTQTAHIVSLYFGLTPEKWKARTVAGLKRLLDEQGGHLVTGFIGTPYFCLALSQNGCLKEAYDLLLKEDFPSWLYQIKMGATTIWEHWDGMRPDGSMWSAGMNSFNHYAYGAVGEWMFRVMAGMDMEEDGAGFRKALIYPRPGGGLTQLTGWHDTLYGRYQVGWQVAGETVTLTVTIPANTTATIRLDDAQAVPEADGLCFTPWQGTLQAEAGSGQYRIVYRRNGEAVG